MAVSAPVGSATPSQPSQIWGLAFEVSSDTVQLCAPGSGCWGDPHAVLSGHPPVCSGAVLSSGWWPARSPKLCCGVPGPSYPPCRLGFASHLPCHYGLAWGPATTGARLAAALALEALCSSPLGRVGLCPLRARGGWGPCLPRCPLWLLAHLSMQRSALAAPWQIQSCYDLVLLTIFS